ncbi:MAG: type II toxin-antitoxin system MqsA family antitoxin [Deltaproteobacteria bacterium]|nr:type II toxin-antitoxin system MqsA family antitoxin [Deltaproteobacteria bacterium]
MKKSDRCASCGGLLMSKKINFDQHWGSDIVVFEAVPARVCVLCGEVWLSSPVLKKMDRILLERRKPCRRLSVPVWSLERLKAA